LDLYISERTNGRYTKPRPLNSLINTLGEENYPFFANDSILFFASTGQGGLGGFDLYYVNLNDAGAIPVNLGSPINSRYDDYNLSISEGGLEGYFVSNRSADKTSFEIYGFKVNKLHASGLVSDERTGENLKNVEIDILKKNRPTSQMVLADNGYFTLEVEPNEEFDLICKKLNYKEKQFHISTFNLSLSGLTNQNIGNFRIKNLLDTFVFPVSVSEILAQDINRNKEKVVNKKARKADEISNDAIKFRVQIAASRIPLIDQALAERYTGRNNIFMFQEEGWFKYAIGEYNSYFEAKKLLKQCGVKDAFIASYLGSKKIPLMSAIRQKNSGIALNQGCIKQQTERTLEILYALDAFEADKVDIERLDTLIDLLTGDRKLFIEIDGYTDIKGSSAYNYSLGAVRAMYIHDYLIRKGIEDKRIKITSFGKSKPKVECSEKCNDSIHAENRRVEVIVFSQ
jgi:outer membrane protein OmpA-like peptidoglycan-associated protein